MSLLVTTDFSYTFWLWVSKEILLKGNTKNGPPAIQASQCGIQFLYGICFLFFPQGRWNYHQILYLCSLGDSVMFLIQHGASGDLSPGSTTYCVHIVFLGQSFNLWAPVCFYILPPFTPRRLWGSSNVVDLRVFSINNIERFMFLMQSFLFQHKWQPLQCSCLGNRMERGAGWAAVHGGAQSRTHLGDSHTHTGILINGVCLPSARISEFEVRLGIYIPEC